MATPARALYPLEEQVLFEKFIYRREVEGFPVSGQDVKEMFWLILQVSQPPGWKIVRRLTDDLQDGRDDMTLWGR